MALFKEGHYNAALKFLEKSNRLHFNLETVSFIEKTNSLIANKNKNEEEKKNTTSSTTKEERHYTPDQVTYLISKKL